jgi:tetratricopeptide (TPR) repeat protein
MSFSELNVRFPCSNQVTVKFDDDETESLVFESPVTKKDLEDLRWYIEVYAAQYTGEPDDEEAKRIEAKLITLGDALFKAVFSTSKTQNLFRQFQQQQTDKLLTIHTNEAQILALPWELLREPQRNFLSQQQPPVSIRRYCVQNQSPTFFIQAKPKLQLLFIVSRPSGASFLNPRLDPQAVMDALAENNISQIEVEFLRPATLQKLEQRLENKALPAVDIIHFDGHGVYDDTEQLGYLLFENPRGKEHLVSAKQLSEILASHQIALMVLSACQSATIGNEPLGSVAAGLTDRGVPTVLAMVYSVLNTTTRQLFSAFYQKLAQGKGIGAALDFARQQMLKQNQRGTRRRGEGEFELTLQDWFVPALYQASNDSVLLSQSDLPGFKNLEGLKRDDLPALQTAGFFGRSVELWKIERWFVQGVERVTITGFGGQGKTYCAIEAAQWLLRTDLFDAVCFVDFSRYQGLDALRYAMNALGVLLDTTLLDENAVPPLLQTRRLLWVWDNLESLAAETLEELLTVAVQWSAQCRFLFTTRQHRFTHSDYVEKPNAEHQYLDLSGLAENDALAYFNQLWQTAPQPEQPYPARYELMALFSKVAFHPLSIGLLAQQLKTRTIAELGERLEALLLCEPVGSEDKSLLASLKLSLERLPPEQRELVKRLGVFQAGAWEGVIEDITEIIETKWAMLSSTLESIGLIQIDRLNHLNVTFPYLKFHPTLAPTLWQEVTPTQQNELSARYRQSYYRLSSSLYFEDRKNPHIARAVALRELPNLFCAVYAALQINEAFAVKFADNLNNFLDDFGLQRDRATLIGMSQSAINPEKDLAQWHSAQRNYSEQLIDNGQYEQAEVILQEILHHLETIPSYEHCLTLELLGRNCGVQGKREEAIRYFQEGLNLAQQLEKTEIIQQHIGVLFTHLAIIFTDKEDFPQARNCYEQALSIAKNIGDIRQEVVVNAELGTLAMFQHNLEEAEHCFNDALELFGLLNEPATEAKIQNQLGMVYFEQKKWKDAESAYRKSAKIKEGQNNLVGAAISWNNIALVMAAQGKSKPAEKWYREAIEIQKNGNPKYLADCLVNLAKLIKKQPSRLNEALLLVETYLPICKTLDDTSSEIRSIYEVMGEIAHKLQQNEKAKKCQQF